MIEKDCNLRFHEFLKYVSVSRIFFFFHFIGRANSTTEGGNAGLSGSVAATQTIMSNNDNQMAAFGPVTPEQEAAKSQVCVTYLVVLLPCCFEMISQNFHYIKNENYELVFFFTKI